MPTRHKVILAFARSLSSGSNITSKSSLCRTTIENYVAAAASLCTDATGFDPRYSYSPSGQRMGSSYFPELQEWMQQLKKWSGEKRQCRPLTRPILNALHSRAGIDSKSACIFDCICLGIFTGSRCSEYCKGQSKGAFSTVPANGISTEWAGYALALIASDFDFLSQDMTSLSWTDAIASSSGKFVRIRFRFDKGNGRNFNIRTFHRMPSCPFCPFAASLRLISRWFHLSRNAKAPVACHLPPASSNKVTYLSDRSVTTAIRQAVKLAYPDTSHLFHREVHLFSTHSLRVTAVFLLKAAGVSDNIIEFKLRWASDAWKMYVRDSFDESEATSIATMTNLSSPNNDLM